MSGLINDKQDSFSNIFRFEKQTSNNVIQTELFYDFIRLKQHISFSEYKNFISLLLQLPTYPSLEGSSFEFTLFTRRPLSGGK